MAAAKKRAPVCIVYTGQSGTGKSTLIGSLDGVTKGKAGAKSDTVGSHMSVDSVTGDKLMDTQGVMDSSGKISDEAITAAVVEAMKNNGVNNVKIVWTMRKSRMSPALQAVAKFIHSLGEPVGALRDLKKWTPVDIWKSVMIIVAEGTGKNQGFGATAAAKEAMQNSSYEYHYHGQEKTIPVFCLSILDELANDDIIKEAALGMERGKRMEKGLLHMTEIGDWQRGLISTLIRPSKVVFKDVRCTRCGASGDPRSLLPACHESFKHPGILEPVMKSKYRTDHFHKGSLLRVTGPKYRTEKYHSGALRAVMRDTYQTTTDHFKAWSELPIGYQVVALINPIVWFSKGLRDEVYGHWPCCGNQHREAKCKPRRIKSGQVRDYREWTCCKKREGAAPCDSKQVQTGTKLLYREWSDCKHREGEKPCGSRTVKIGEAVDFRKYSECGCREGRPVEFCSARICKVCDGKYGSKRPRTARCHGTHKFVDL